MAEVAVASSARYLHVFQLAVGLLTALIYNVLRSTLLLVKKRPKSLEGDIALVTAAGETLGRELACKLNEEGCTIICVDHDAIRCQETASIINHKNFQRGINRKAYSYHYDICDQYQVAHLAQQIYADHGHVDILIKNSSKIRHHGHVMDSISDSLHSYFWLILAFLPGMLKRHHGHIVAVLPSAALTGKETHTVRKQAVQGLLDRFSQELKLDSRFIKLTSVQPFVSESTESFTIPELTAECAAQEIVHAVKHELGSILIPRNAFVWQSVLNTLCEDTSDVWRDAFNFRRLEARDSLLPGWGPP